MKAKILNLIQIFLSFVGIFIAGTLSYAHKVDSAVPCGGSSDCATVLSHPSSVWFNIPVAIYGLVGYMVILILSCVRAFVGLHKTQKIGSYLMLMTGAGMLLSIGLLVYSKVGIDATCRWCVGSGATMLALFIVTYLMNDAVANEPPSDVSVENPTEAGMSMPFMATLAVSAVLSFGGLGMMFRILTPDNSVTEIDAGKRDFVIGADPNVLGNPNADITLIDFADFNCPTCRRSFSKVTDLVKEYPNLRVIYRHFPIPGLKGHELSVPAAILSEYAATKGKFWEFAAEAMNPEREFLKIDDYYALIAKLGLDVKEAEAAVADQNSVAFNRVYEDLDAANKLGLRGTPMYIVIYKDEKPLAMQGIDLDKMLSTSKFSNTLKEKK